MASVATDRRQGVNSGAAIKVPVKAASTANLTLSGEQTVDGVALVDGDRVLVKNQTTASENGIYDVDTGSWTRSPDWDGSYDVKEGTFVYVTDGTVNAGLFYTVTTADPITVGTTSITFGAVTPSSVLTMPLPVAQGGSGQDTATEAATAFGLVQLTGAGGTANAQTAGAPSNLSAFAANQVFAYTPSVTNTGATTVTVTPSGGAALAAQNVFAGGAALVGGELIASVPVLLLHDGTRLNLIGSLPASDARPLVVGSADPTKKVRIEADGIATATTRVWTAPDADLTVVGMGTAQALTNKTITDSTNTVAAGVLGTEQASTSGTAIDFTSIPSWAKKISIQFVGVSISGTANIIVQIGDSGGIETTGYLGAAAAMTDATAVSAANFTAGFGLLGGSAANVFHGRVVLELEDAANFTWIAAGNVSLSNAAQAQIAAGSKSLSAALDRVRITTSNGTDTFDAGAINILCE